MMRSIHLPSEGHLPVKDRPTLTTLPLDDDGMPIDWQAFTVEARRRFGRRCRKCGNADLSYGSEGRHVAERCADCGVWVQTDRAHIGLPVRTGMLTRVPGITPSMRHAAIDRSGGRCEVCGREVGVACLETRFVVPMEIAKAEGWSKCEWEHRENLIAVCGRCGPGEWSRHLKPSRVLLIIQSSSHRKSAGTVERPELLDMSIVNTVRSRAVGACETCGTRDHRIEIGHVIPRVWLTEVCGWSDAAADHPSVLLAQCDAL